MITLNQLHHLPWKMVWHVSGDICVSVYEAVVGFNTIIKECRTERRDFFDYGKTTTIYRFNGKRYRSHKSVVEAINETLNKQKR